MQDDEGPRTEKSTTEELIKAFTEKRRRVASEQAKRDEPDYLVSIEGVTVKYNIRQVALPLAQVDTETFVRGMTEWYSTTLTPVGPGDLVKHVSASRLHEMSQTELLGQVFKRDTTKSVTFEGGRFQLKGDFVPIRMITITLDSIYVWAEGHSQVAEVIAQEVAQLLWAAAGFKRTWEEISPEVYGMSYGTQTRVRLPVPLTRLLGPELQSLVNDHLLDNENFASKMRPLEKSRGYDAGENINSVVTLNTITFNVDTFDMENGVGHSGLLFFNVTSRLDITAGILLISSALRFPEHMQLVDLLVRDLSVDSG